MTDTSKHLESLLEFLRIPSISTLPEHRGDMLRAVKFLEDELEKARFTHVKRINPPGREDAPPLLFASRIDDPKNPTILLYGHYDVQPPDPLEDWISPPFEPEIRGGNIYARGATDDKGQLFTHIAALNECSSHWGDKWPVNVKCLFEGEEEMGGESLREWFASGAANELLKADVCILSDSEFVEEGQPAIDYGIRGLAYFEMTVKLADMDLHSGLYGGGVRNPANALAHIITHLHDQKTGKVLVPHFYDDVISISEDERKSLAKLPFEENKWLENAGHALGTFGEEGYTTVERTTARPTLDVNGIWGGFMGDGQKTIIPSHANAKFSCRLVANQDPEKIAGLVQEYVRSICPQGVHADIRCLSHGNGALIDRNSAWMKAAATALKENFGKEPLFIRSGGSIPVVADIKKHLGIDSILVAYGLPDDHLHAPNEKFALSHFERGIACNMRLYELISKIKR